VLKTSGYRKKKSIESSAIPFHLTDEIKNKFKDAIRIRTISHSRYDENDLKEFNKIRTYIESSFPAVNSRVEVLYLNDYSVVLKWTGKVNDKKPVLLISHFDVVPVIEEEWSVSPFDAVEKDGFIWGRGTLDTKNTLVALLEASEQLIQEGFIPERTIYLAFGGDEETQGTEGAGRINKYFKEKNIEFEWLLDEGGVVADKALSIVEEPMALVGISEKGFTNIRISCEGQAGHSSMPPGHTAAGVLAKAIVEIEKNPFPAKITPGISSFLYSITPYVSYPVGIILANHKIFSLLIKKIFLKTPSSAALLRTTQAVTILKSGTKENILPSAAEAVINIRILPGETVSSVLRRIRTLLKKHKVTVEIADKNDSNDPIVESSLDCEGFKLLENAIAAVFPQAVTVPYMMTGATDSKHYRDVCKNIYRFSPMGLNMDEISLIHSADERISVKNLEKAIKFYMTLIKNI
jgi:carboxypeptidase PM20D1